MLGMYVNQKAQKLSGKVKWNEFAHFDTLYPLVSYLRRGEEVPPEQSKLSNDKREERKKR